MTEHEHGPDCSHNAAEVHLDDIKGEETGFSRAFKYAAAAGLILFVALMLPLPGGWETKRIIVFVGTILGIAVFPLAYIQTRKK